MKEDFSFQVEITKRYKRSGFAALRVGIETRLENQRGWSQNACSNNTILTLIGNRNLDLTRDIALYELRYMRLCPNPSYWPTALRGGRKSRLPRQGAVLKADRLTQNTRFDWNKKCAWRRGRRTNSVMYAATLLPGSTLQCKSPPQSGSRKPKRSPLLDRLSSLRLKQASPSNSEPDLGQGLLRNSVFNKKSSQPRLALNKTIKAKPGDFPASRSEGQKLKDWEIRELRELIRYRYALDIEIWGSRYAEVWDRGLVYEKMKRSDAALLKILRYMSSWDRRDLFTTNGEYEKFKELKRRLFEGGKRLWENKPPWDEATVPQGVHSRRLSLDLGNTASLARRDSSTSTGIIEDSSTRPTTATVTATASTTSTPTLLPQPEHDIPEKWMSLDWNVSSLEYAPRFPDESLEEISTHQLILESANRTSRAKRTSQDHSTIDSKSFSLIDWNSIGGDAKVPSPRSERLKSSIAERTHKPSLLDPASYFASLDALELKVASMCQFDKTNEWRINLSPAVTGGFPDSKESYMKDMAQRVRDIESLQKAFELLETEGYCKNHFSALVQDWKRFERENILVANTVHVTSGSLEEIAEIGRRASKHLYTADRRTGLLLAELTGKLTSFLEKLGLSIPTARVKNTLSRFIGLFDFVCSILRLTLISYTGSHNCPFDETVLEREISSFDLTEGCALRRKRLKCLDEYVGGPVWIWEQEDTGEEEYLLSISIEQLVDLWGPVWIMPTDGLDVSPMISTTRGIIESMSAELTSAGEVQCHFSASSDTTGQAVTCPVPLHTTTRLLIGMESFFAVNEKCSGGVKVYEKRNNGLFQPPGTHKDFWVLENIQGGIAVGQHLVPTSIFVFKRNPGVTYKHIIIDSLLDPSEDHMPWLKQTVGLEISSCTANAQRVSLWEALSIVNQKKKPQPHQTTCAHQVGAYDCIKNCWGYVPKRQSIEEHEVVHEAILRSLRRLQYTGFDKSGKFQAWWPFSDHPQTLQIKKTQEDKSWSSNWLTLLRDSWVVATFAVISRRCLEYEYTTKRTPNELCVWRKCGRASEPSGHKIRTDLTLFGTELHLQSPLDPSQEESPTRTSQSLLVGTRLRVKEVGTVKIVNEDDKQPQLAEFEKGWPRIGGKVVYSEYFLRDNSDQEASDDQTGFLRLFIA